MRPAVRASAPAHPTVAPARGRLPTLLATLLLAFGLFWQAALAQQGDRDEVRAQLQRLGQDIAALQQQLEGTREDFRREQEALREADLEIQGIARNIREIESQQQQHAGELQQLEVEQAALLDSMGSEQQELGRQLRASYRLGSTSRLKLLLNQDDLGAMSRVLAYYRYFNQARVQQIDRLRGQIRALEENQLAIEAVTRQLALDQQQLEGRLEDRQQARETRAGQVETLNRRIADSESRLTELQRNQRDLEVLLERLSRALADIPEALGQDLRLSAQRGQLPAPLSQRVMFRYGDARSGNIRWQGWQYAAEPGVPVHAIGHGRVAFADWLRGYGLMLIIDHGDGFLSLYGHNEVLLHDVGDWVQPGAVISQGGSHVSLNGAGVYFELRRDGKAIDPAGWIAP